MKKVKSYFKKQNQEVKRKYSRINILAKLQFSNRRKEGTAGKKALVLRLSIRVFIFIIITVALLVVLGLLNNLLKVKVTKEMVTAILLIIQTISIVSVINGLMKDMYDGIDNGILMSFPVKNNEVYFSKLLVNYFYELIRNMVFIIPFLLATAILLKASMLFYFGILFLIFVLPLISILVASLLTIPVVYLKNFLSGKTVAPLILFMIILIGIFLGSFFISKTIPEPLHVLGQIKKITENIQAMFSTLSLYSSFYLLMGNLLFAKTVGSGFLMFGSIIVTVVLLLIINYFISSPVYFQLASKTREHTVKEKKEGINSVSRSTFLAFLKKEVKISIRNINELFSDYLLLIIMPFIMFFIFYLFAVIPVNFIGKNVALGVNLLIILMFVLSSNTASATAITKEGYEFVLLKTAPTDTKTIAWAKVTLNLAFSTVLILLAFIVFQILVPYANFGYLWELFGIVILFNVGHILWSFQLDLIKPELSEYATTGSIDQNKNAARSVEIGMVLALGLAILVVFLGFMYTSFLWPVVYLFAVCFIGARFWLFNQYLNAYFPAIQY